MATACNRVRGRAMGCGVALGVALLPIAGCTSGATSAADLAGVDADRNGVRDDVDTYIAGLDPAYAEFLTSFAANEQRAVTLDVEAPDAMAEAFEILDNVNIFVSCPPAELDPRVAREEIHRLVARVANTPERRKNHDRVSSMNSGRSMPAPDCSATSPAATAATAPQTND